MHRELITKDKALTCAECHSPHARKRIADRKPDVNVNQHCLACHRHELSISIAGKVMSLKIDESLLKGSVHNKHSCTDCHAEFSKEQHPVRTFASIRNHSITVSGVCRKCHSDKFALVEGSIHSVMLKKGMLGAPVCTDCHGFHTVSPKAKYKTMVGAPCKKCHEDIFNAYKESVHGKAKVKGVEKAPICSSCHQAHDVKVTSLTKQMKSVCLGCHEGAIDAHKKWLTNTELHLDAIGCAACHSPNVEREIYLRFYNLTAGTLFFEEHVLNLLGTDRDGLRKELDPDGNGIDAYELGRIAGHLEKKGMKVALVGRMDIRKGTDPHQLALKSDAVKDCERCHRADSEFFKHVSVAVIRADGKPTIFEAKQEVLGSLVSLLPLSNFYVLGSTRIWLLDILFILAVLGGVSVPVAHIMLRILTIPIREARRLKALKKEGK
jgi:predicted CXXCH cytochrome family protein